MLTGAKTAVMPQRSRSVIPLEDVMDNEPPPAGLTQYGGARQPSFGGISPPSVDRPKMSETELKDMVRRQQAMSPSGGLPVTKIPAMVPLMLESESGVSVRATPMSGNKYRQIEAGVTVPFAGGDLSIDGSYGRVYGKYKDKPEISRHIEYVRRFAEGGPVDTEDQISGLMANGGLAVPSMAKGGEVSPLAGGMNIHHRMRNEFAKRGLDFDGFLSTKAEARAAAEKLKSMGNDGDTILAHINPREAALLKEHGGSGTINPKTGLLQFGDGEGGSGGRGDGGSGSANDGGGSNDRGGGDNSGGGQGSGSGAAGGGGQGDGQGSDRGGTGDLGGGGGGVGDKGGETGSGGQGTGGKGGEGGQESSKSDSNPSDLGGDPGKSESLGSSPAGPSAPSAPESLQNALDSDIGNLGFGAVNPAMAAMMAGMVNAQMNPTNVNNPAAQVAGPATPSQRAEAFDRAAKSTTNPEGPTLADIAAAYEAMGATVTSTPGVVGLSVDFADNSSKSNEQGTGTGQGTGSGTSSANGGAGGTGAGGSGGGAGSGSSGAGGTGGGAGGTGGGAGSGGSGGGESGSSNSAMAAALAALAAQMTANPNAQGTLATGDLGTKSNTPSMALNPNAQNAGTVNTGIDKSVLAAGTPSINLGLTGGVSANIATALGGNKATETPNAPTELSESAQKAAAVADAAGKSAAPSTSLAASAPTVGKTTAVAPTTPAAPSLTATIDNATSAAGKAVTGLVGNLTNRADLAVSNPFATLVNGVVTGALGPPGILANLAIEGITGKDVGQHTQNFFGIDTKTGTLAGIGNALSSPNTTTPVNPTALYETGGNGGNDYVNSLFGVSAPVNANLASNQTLNDESSVLNSLYGRSYLGVPKDMEQYGYGKSHNFYSNYGPLSQVRNT